jgi:hypothetical protein
MLGLCSFMVLVVVLKPTELYNCINLTHTLTQQIISKTRNIWLRLMIMCYISITIIYFKRWKICYYGCLLFLDLEWSHIGACDRRSWSSHGSWKWKRKAKRQMFHNSFWSKIHLLKISTIVLSLCFSVTKR